MINPLPTLARAWRELVIVALLAGIAAFSQGYEAGQHSVKVNTQPASAIVTTTAPDPKAPR